ncbi:hypothetical protein [Paraburkholderia solisilvae]|uniref:Uncharacterized protein n=1 Tax=Paraburkholderia solisilvae TaxID=624376 RepID=A0A6J5ECY8_9BURK|nr:hypothetical protein [Paraburkholderia solisilvae]CAB3764339.1 hypothetical protein LMG29739_04332 [Paraburkholderia solisilvae]
MQNHIPTIEELRGKSARELSAIFREASVIAADATRPAQERKAALKIVENIQRCLRMLPSP